MNLLVIKKYIKILYLEIRISIRKFTTYKIDFVLSLFSMILYILTYLLFIGYLFLRVHAIANWNIYQILILIGFGQFWAGFYFMFIFTSSRKFIDDFIQGQYDFIVLKPINTRFMIFVKDIDFSSLVLIIEGIILIAYSFVNLHFAPSFEEICLTMFIFVIALHIAFNMQSILLSIYILIPQRSHLYNLLNDFSEFGNFPYEVYGKFMFLVLTFVVPIVILVNFPVRALLGISTFNNYIIVFVVEILFMFASNIMWRFSMKRYVSFGG